jgi:hypothetical protein
VVRQKPCISGCVHWLLFAKVTGLRTARPERIFGLADICNAFGK